MQPLYIHANALLIVSRARRELNPVFSKEPIKPVEKKEFYNYDEYMKSDEYALKMKLKKEKRLEKQTIKKKCKKPITDITYFIQIGKTEDIDKGMKKLNKGLYQKHYRIDYAGKKTYHQHFFMHSEKVVKERLQKALENKCKDYGLWFRKYKIEIVEKWEHEGDVIKFDKILSPHDKSRLIHYKIVKKSE